jgi:pilus assembly protein CpaC
MSLRQLKPCLVVLQASLLLLLAAAVALAGVPTTVTLNKSVLINLKSPARYVSIADKEVIDVPDPLRRNQLLINGKKIGSTSLIVWEENVEKPTFFDVNVVGDQDVIEAKIREYAPRDSIRAQYVQDTVILSGTAASEVTKKRAEEIARAYLGKGGLVTDKDKDKNRDVLNYISIDVPQQVLLQVKVAQVDKTSLKNLGISTIVKGSTAEGFTNLAGAPSNNTTGSTSVTNGKNGIAGNGPGLGSFDPLDAFQVGASYFPAGVGAVLQALSTKGLAKVLAEPNLLVKSGQVGNFLAGSKIPYTVLVSQGGSTTPSIVWENVGITIKFKPEVLANGLISLKIDPAEVSSISGTLAANGYPIIDTRDVQTEVELHDGESLVLAGLLQEEQIKSLSKIPLMGDIPILGALFRSTHDEIREKELVFFITPKLVLANAPGTETTLPTDRELDPDEAKELNWMPLGD